MAFPDGTYVRGYMASNDLTTAVPIPLFDANGTAYVIQPGKRLLIDELLLANGAVASVITVFADVNGNGTLDAGEELISMNLGVTFANAFPSAGLGPVASRVIGATTLINRLMVVASIASASTRIMLIGRIVNT